jgi:ribonuclease Z
MTDPDHFTLATERFTIEGRSRAGHETWFRIRELGLALDIGRCPDPLISIPHVFVSHAHLDHSAGIPYYAGQRHLFRLHGGVVYVPIETLADYRALMEIHVRLEGTDYDVDLVGLAEGDVTAVSRNVRVRTHRATHRVPANAYEVVERRHHLKAEFGGRSEEEIAALRRQGVEVAEWIEMPLLFYTGDTDRGILEKSSALYEADVLMIECSFMAEGHQDRAARYRHIHFDDIAEFAERFENRLILLTHFSRRYSQGEIRDELRRRCPASLRDRIRLPFPEPWQRL